MELSSIGFSWDSDMPLSFSRTLLSCFHYISFHDVQIRHQPSIGQFSLAFNLLCKISFIIFAVGISRFQTYFAFNLLKQTFSLVVINETTTTNISKLHNLVGTGLTITIFLFDQFKQPRYF